MASSPKSPSITLTQNPLSLRLYKVLAANFDDDATKEALGTLTELYAPTPTPVVAAKTKGKEFRQEKVESDEDQDDDSFEDGGGTTEKVANGNVPPVTQPVSGEIAANARKNLRRDVESKLTESSRRFLTAFAEVDKVCHSVLLLVP
jgi:conserved oligomeric Golgi complex subunit 6